MTTISLHTRVAPVIANLLKVALNVVNIGFTCFVLTKVAGVSNVFC